MSAEPTNKQRAVRCGKALIRYGTDDDPGTCLADFLADAMHYCDANGEDFHYALCIAGKHYLAELNDDQTEERRLP
jgi:hypothetical protein